MRQMAFVSAWTAVLAVVGYFMGSTLHGPTLTALIPAIAGGAGGFGIGCASLEVWRRWQVSPGRRVG
jgi:hypothetical protein